MSDASEYRRRAEEYEDLGRNIKDESLRAKLLNIAEEFRRLAEDAENKGGQIN